MNTYNNVRTRLSMDKDWKFNLGDVEIQYGKEHSHVYAFAKAGGQLGPAHMHFNDKKWDVVNVPHDWVLDLDFDQNERPNLGYKTRGKAWYRKSFLIDEEYKGKQITIELDGISGNSTVYFNGSILKRNWSSYNSFYIDITDRAYFGNIPNTIAIYVDASLWEGWWYEGAGIYRHVWMNVKENVHVAQWGVWVNPEKLDNHTWCTKIETTLENSKYEDQMVTLKSTIYNEANEVVGTAVSNHNCEAAEATKAYQEIIVTEPKLWDVDEPNLYKCVTEIFEGDELKDREETTFGYRTIRICSETGFYLNERNIKLKGTCNHQDHAGVGVALPDYIHEYRIQRLKEMGSNAYRSAHNNPAKEILDACDKLGIMVMNENRKFESCEEVQQEIEAMVLRDRNHPSVIMYSIFNEEPHQGTPQGRNMSKRMMHTIKRLDNTRPVLGALNGSILDEKGTADVLDITGINYQTGSYDEFRAKFPGQPIVGSETNSFYATRGVYTSDSKKQTFNNYDEHHAPWGASIRHTWKQVNTRDFVMGLFAWTGFDYRGEPTPYVWPSVSSFFGIMDTCGFAKDGYYLHKAYWDSTPMVHMLPHWNWEGKEGELIKVMTHTNCEEVEVILNGKSQGRKQIDVYEQATWEVAYEPGTIQMIGYNQGKAVHSVERHTSGKIVGLRLEPAKNKLKGTGTDAIPINVYGIDENGIVVPTASNYVTFEIEGLGEILGVGNGDPNSHEADKVPYRNLFNGCCQVILQATKGQGEVKLIAHSEGLRSEVLTLTVEAAGEILYVNTISEQPIMNWRMYYEALETKPDATVEIQESDMNTWEPVMVGMGPQSKLDNKFGCYGMYRTTIDKNDLMDASKAVLYFYRVKGLVEVYINGNIVCQQDAKHGDDMSVSLADIAADKIEVTVIIKVNDEADPRAGISGAVRIRE